MVKKYKKETLEQDLKETLKETQEESIIKEKGREEDFFFPSKMKTVKATSLEEAIKKLK